MNKKNNNNRELIERAIEIPKVSIAFVGGGILMIIYSFISLTNPFFLFSAIMLGLGVIYVGYDQWYKKLNDKKVSYLSEKLDSVSVELYSKGYLR
jgi:xanthosine utilization system XapX-like protein